MFDWDDWQSDTLFVVQNFKKKRESWMAGVLYGVGVGPGNPEPMTHDRERVCRGIEEIPDDVGYYPLIRAKETECQA